MIDVQSKETQKLTNVRFGVSDASFGVVDEKYISQHTLPMDTELHLLN